MEIIIIIAALIAAIFVARSIKNSGKNLSKQNVKGTKDKNVICENIARSLADALMQAEKDAVRDGNLTETVIQASSIAIARIMASHIAAAEQEFKQDYLVPTIRTFETSLNKFSPGRMSASVVMPDDETSSGKTTH